MAQFRATIKGQRGSASRLGNKKSGLIANVNGWNIGVAIEIFYDKTLKKDVITIYKTNGSNSQPEVKVLGYLIEGDIETLHSDLSSVKGIK